jgi:hypothetical protein
LGEVREEHYLVNIEQLYSVGFEKGTKKIAK